MTTLHRALTTGAAAHLHQAGVGFFVDGQPIPPGTGWPIYLYEWGAAEQQLVVNFPVTAPEPAATFDTSLQVLVRARTDALAEAKAAAATDAFTPSPFPALGGVDIRHIEHLSLARLGKDANGRAMWVSKFRLYGRNK